MTLPLIIIRPQPGADKTAALAHAQCWDAQIHPLFAITPLQWDIAPGAPYDAVLLGSANAIRHGGGTLEKIRCLPAYTVGETTADAARQAGFTVATTGVGGLAAVLPDVRAAGHRRLLWLSARDYTPLPDHDFDIDRVDVYAAKALPMPDALAGILQKPAVVALHSARAASHFRNQCEQAQIDRAQLSLACFGPRIVEAAGEGWRTIATAAAHDDGALLAAARDLCRKQG